MDGDQRHDGPDRPGDADGWDSADDWNPAEQTQPMPAADPLAGSPGEGPADEGPDEVHADPDEHPFGPDATAPVATVGDEPASAPESHENEAESSESEAESTAPLPAVEVDDEPDTSGAAGAAGAVGAAGAAGAVGTAAPAGTAYEGRSRGRRIATIVGVVVLLAALAAAAWWWWDTTTKQQRDEAIRMTVTTYLTAVADADAAAALDTLEEVPANQALLTDEVLQASRDAAPLSDVAISSVTPEGNNATVAVTYRIGEQPVETTLSLVGDGRTDWRIADGTADLSTTTTEALTINGAEVTELVNPVLPGTYAAASTNQHIALGGQTTALVASPDVQGTQLTPEHALSEAGTQAVLAAVKGRFDECLASTETLPENCPFGVDPGGAEVTPGSVRFQATNDPWAGFAPALDVATLSASGTIRFEITAFANVTFEGRSGDVSTPVAGERVWRVDLTQEPLTVTWS